MMDVQATYDLIQGLPPGEWVAISVEEGRILATSETVEGVYEEGERVGQGQAATFYVCSSTESDLGCCKEWQPRHLTIRVVTAGCYGRWCGFC